MLRPYEIKDTKIVESSASCGNVLVYLNPQDEEKRFLVDTLALDEHTLNSVLDPDELARLEFEQDHVALIFKRPRNFSYEGELVFKVSSIGLFLFNEKLIIILTDDAPLFDGKIFNRVKSLQDLFLKLLYRTIAHYVEHLKVINMLSDSLEKKINASLKNKYLIDLFTLEKSLVYYFSAINGNAMVIEKLKYAAEKIGFSVESIEFLDDVIIENNQCLKQAEIYSNILASLMDARVSIVSNNLNVLMKTLTIITLTVMVPTFVVSMFSMNVKIPLAEYSFAFWIIVGMAALPVAGILLFWRLKRW